MLRCRTRLSLSELQASPSPSCREALGIQAPPRVHATMPSLSDPSNGRLAGSCCDLRLPCARLCRLVGSARSEGPESRPTPHDCTLETRRSEGSGCTHPTAGTLSQSTLSLRVFLGRRVPRLHLVGLFWLD